MEKNLALSQFEAALQAVESDTATPEEKAGMLVEIAMGLQIRPKSPEQLQQAIVLYRRALEICPADAPLLRARTTVRLGTALQALPDEGLSALREAQACYDVALAVLKDPMLKDKVKPEELAEIQMNLGLVLQSLAATGAARIQDAIQCYHQALKIFTCNAFPQEYAILHNNLAIAYLSIPHSDTHGKLREALAVQSFEEVLKVINLVDHPTEYAMIQNNLGNALQYASSSHALENNLRALLAYDEALKVRNAHDTPLEYANTLANKANVLRNLPDEGAGNQTNLDQARTLYAEARDTFIRFQQFDSARIVAEALAEIEQELAQRVSASRNIPQFS